MKNCRHESPHKQLGHLGCSAPSPTTWEIQVAPARTGHTGEDEAVWAPPSHLSLKCP